MLSNMESNSARNDPDEPRTALASADQARHRLTTGLRLPAGFHPALATAVAVQLGAAAWGIAAQTVTGLVVVLAGLVVFVAVVGILLHRFRRINGVRVDGLASQIALMAQSPASLVYLAALAAGTWAGFASQWWVAAATAVAGGAGCAFGTRTWWHAYRHDPAAHARGASPRVLGASAVLASLAFAALLLVG